MVNTVIPTGVVRRMPDGLTVFTTTDRAGTITGANRAFVDVSRLAPEQIWGAPHNIIRHPEMPGGQFTLWWQQLTAGGLAAGYLLNLAADGASYWTFAVALPAGEDRFLAVSIEVSRPDHHQVVRHAYDAARAAERKMRSAGMSPIDAALESSHTIANLLVDAGLGSYSDAIATILPDEVDAWHRAPRPPLPAAVLREGHEIGRVLSATKEIDEELAAVRTRLSEYLELAASLGAEADSLSNSVGNLARTVAVAADASEQVAGSAPVLARAAAAAANLAHEASAHLQSLPASLNATRRELLELRSLVALGVLHTSAAESFAVEVARGEAGGNALESREVRCPALEATGSTLEQSWNKVGVDIADIAAQIDQATEELSQFQRMLLDWRNLVVRFRMTGVLSGMLGDIDGQESRSRARMASLRALAAQCRELARPLDLTKLRRALARVRDE